MPDWMFTVFIGLERGSIGVSLTTKQNNLCEEKSFFWSIFLASRVLCSEDHNNRHSMFLKLELSSKFSETVVMLRLLHCTQCDTIVLLQHSVTWSIKELPGPEEHCRRCLVTRDSLWTCPSIPCPLCMLQWIQLTTDICILTLEEAVNL
jgi:hypothetical protein